mgnify:CR=1 FL=1
MSRVDTFSALPERFLTEIRRKTFGFVFQRYHLLAEMTALGNVEMPAVYAGTGPAARRSPN